jgi:2-polyprenyl-3-methyl-5-hydroxy-6-metoxy-1,4-benzoquinol methylase
MRLAADRSAEQNRGMTDLAQDYAFPHVAVDESRRLELFEQRLDPLTIRRIEHLGLTPDVHCLEIGGGRGSMTRWLCDFVGSGGSVTVTDLQTDFLTALPLPNLTVLRHDLRTDDFPAGAFDFIHARAVLMLVDQRMTILNRMVSWLAPGGWILLEEPDFGLWAADLDSTWSAHPRAWHEAFPHGSMSQGRALPRQIGRLGLEETGADAELDVVAPGTSAAEFYQLSMAAMQQRCVEAGILTSAEAGALTSRPTDPDFLGCGFAYIGTWGRKPRADE